MNKQTVVNEIIHGGSDLISLNHIFANDIEFFDLLRKEAERVEWYEVASFCNIQISLIQSKKKLDSLASSGNQFLKAS